MSFTDQPESSSSEEIFQATHTEKPSMPTLPFSAQFLDKSPEASAPPISKHFSSAHSRLRSSSSRCSRYTGDLSGGHRTIPSQAGLSYLFFPQCICMAQFFTLVLQDFDGGVVGQSVSASLSDLNSGRGGIAWHVVPATQFPQGITQLQRAVVLEKTWYAVAVNAGASSNLSGAISTIDPSYTSASVVTFMGSEARNENLYRLQTHIFIAQLEIVVNQFAVQFIKNISTSNNLPTLLSAAPEIIARPIYYTVDNLRPFDASVATGSTFFGLIYILITAFIVVLIGTAARMSSGLEHRLSFGSLVRLRLGTLFVTFFFITLIYTLLNRAFQLPFDRQFGRAGFLVFWMLNYLNMLACGLALEVMISILTRLTPFFLITWIISNVSVAVWPLQVLPHVYRYGYAFPFYNASRAVRVVVFGTKNEVGLNAGVLIAWIALSCLTLPLVQWVMRRRLAVSNSPARAA